MKENTAASVQEFVWQWQRSAQMTQPTEVDQAMAVWQAQRRAERGPTFRALVAKGLATLATRIAPTVTVPNPNTPVLVQ